MSLGATEAAAETALAARAPEEAGDYELWPEHLEPFGVFCALETQWRIVAGFGFARHVGLRYAEATNLMRERGIKRARRAELLDELRIMERAALGVLNKADDDA